MSILSNGTLEQLIATYGYWAVGGIIALESMGIPLPGETTLIAAAIIAGTSHALNIWLVVGAAAAGAILGDNVGFWIGREFGFWLVVRYGRYIRLTEERVKLGQYLFIRHGGKVVFFGRFVAVLRAFAAFLAGVDCMEWPRFLLFNAAGGVVWAAVYGFGTWYVGEAIAKVAGHVGVAIGIAAVSALVVGFFVLRRYEAELLARAEANLPAPLRRAYPERRRHSH